MKGTGKKMLAQDEERRHTQGDWMERESKKSPRLLIGSRFALRFMTFFNILTCERHGSRLKTMKLRSCMRSLEDFLHN